MNYCLIFMFGVASALVSCKISTSCNKEQKEKNEKLMKSFEPQFHSFIDPALKLACCKDPKIEPALREASHCIKDKKLKAELTERAEEYKKHINDYCDKKGKPIMKTVMVAIKCEIDKCLNDPNMSRYLGAMCMKDKLVKMLTDFKAKCGL